MKGVSNPEPQAQIAVIPLYYNIDKVHAAS